MGISKQNLIAARQLIAMNKDTNLTFARATDSLEALRDYLQGTILAAIQGIQNNTQFAAAVPIILMKPEVGNEAYRSAANLYDEDGSMLDPTNNEILVRIIKSDGTYITANLYKENALSTPLDNATDQVNFPAASGWRAMEREAAGKFFYFYKIASTETEEDLSAEFAWDISGTKIYQTRSTEVMAYTLSDSWAPETPQTGTKTLTNQSQYYPAFTAYSSSTKVVRGPVTIKFPASKTYNVKIKLHAAGNDFEPIIGPIVIGATPDTRTFNIPETEYVDVQVECTDDTGQVITYYRNLDFMNNAGIAAPTT